jgi:hypothetical protein
MRIKHVGNGVDVVCRSGRRFKAAAGEVISVRGEDAAALLESPEWVKAPSKKSDAVVVDAVVNSSEDSGLEGDSDEHS